MSKGKNNLGKSNLDEGKNYPAEILNAMIVLSSTLIIGGMIWPLSQESTVCLLFMDKPAMVLRAIIVFVFIAAAVGLHCSTSNSRLLWVYLLLMFLLISLLLCISIMAFVVTNQGAGEAVSGKGYKEYRLGDYSNWLQKVFINDNWGNISSFLADREKICQKLLDDGTARADDFDKEHLSSLESGCCKPSNDCNFEYVSPTNWTRTSTAAPQNPDCAKWSNEPKALCYACDSCKAGLLDNIKSDWKKMTIINIIVLFFLIIVYFVAVAMRFNGKDIIAPCV